MCVVQIVGCHHSRLWDKSTDDVLAEMRRVRGRWALQEHGMNLRDVSYGPTRAVRKVSSHFEYLENRSRGLDVTWQPVRGDLTAHP